MSDTVPYRLLSLRERPVADITDMQPDTGIPFHRAVRDCITLKKKNDMNSKELQSGDIATLKVPHKGYRRIELVEQLQYTWLARISESGKEIEVHEDEFELDD